MNGERGDDALVIGGGFAGLSAAVHLAAGGASVRLLEQDERPGGKAGEVRLGGYRFDTGPSVLTLPGVLDEVFAAAGRTNPLALEPLEPLCRYVYGDGFVWDVSRDADASAAQLPPAEARAYRSLLGEARRLYEAAAPTFVFGRAPGPLELLRYGLRHGLAAHPHRSLPELLAHHGAGPRTTPFFLRFATYYGADPYRAPAVLHNIAWVELGLGVVYPRGGLRAVVDALADLARDLGATIETGATVTALEARGGRLARVRWRRADGSEVAANPARTVAALDRQRALQLLGRRAAPGEPSLSGAVLLLGVRPEAGRGAGAHHTILFPDDYAAEFAALRAGRAPSDPTLYLNVSSLSDPDDAPPGGENWFAMANAPALPADGEGAPDEGAMARTIERTLERRGALDGVRVEERRFLGPRHLARYGHRGAIYGRAPHGLLSTLRPPQQLRGPGGLWLGGLWLAGGTVYPGGGVPLALLSGREAARAALR